MAVPCVYIQARGTELVCIYHPLRTHKSMIQDAIKAEHTQQPVNGIKGHSVFSKYYLLLLQTVPLQTICIVFWKEQ